MKRRGTARALAVTLIASVGLGMVGAAWAVDEVGRIRDKCEEFFDSLAKNEYKVFAEAKHPNYERIHKDFSYLFKQKKVDLLEKRAATSQDPKEARALRLLATALRVSAVRAHAAADLDQMYEFMMTADVTYDGQTVSFGEVRRKIAMEEDRNKRRMIYIALNSPLEPLKVFKLGALSKMKEKLGGWGFESYLDMLAQGKEIDPESLEKTAVDFLDSTDSLYTAELSKLLQEKMGIELRRARGYDIPYLLRGSWLDGEFSSKRGEAAVKETFSGMGLKADGARLEYKTSKFCGESLVARVFPLRIPDEVKMCYADLGGVCDLDARLYMRGKAEYVASIDQPRYFELGRLGNMSSYEAAGLLFSSLMCDPAWLVEKVGLDPGKAADVARHSAFVRLFEARRSCVSVLLQLAVYSDGRDPSDIYGELIKKYMKWDPVLDRSRAALEMNDLDSAFKMQGYFLSAQLASVLKSRFGDKWFTSPDAGAFLKDLWRPGQELTLEQVARKLGGEGVVTSFLAEEVTNAIWCR